MSDVLNLPNSIWPNGIKVDDEGYAVFYPLGTNKIEVPTDSSSWPTGDKLVSPFVYQNDRLVGFCDTMAMTVSGNTTITMPYEHIEANFASISEGKLTVNAPNAVVKKFSWSVVSGEGSSENEEVIITLKYKDCKTFADVKAVDPDFLINDIIDGVWKEGLCDLEKPKNTFDYLFRGSAELISFYSDLSSLTDGNKMFENCSHLTSFKANLPNLTNGTQMFSYCETLQSFTTDLPKLVDASAMFSSTQLVTFNIDLPNLEEGYGMFSNCKNLESFSSNLPKLTSVLNMFGWCSNFTSFNSEVPSLRIGDRMFNCCSSLSSISFDTSKITSGDYMFYGCNFSSFSSDLSSLEKGTSMFVSNSNLSSFSSKLSKLTDGTNMFKGCKLDSASIQNIINTINTHSGNLTLGMGCKSTTTDKNVFAQELGYADMTSLLADIQSKGWTVTAQYNGRPSTSYSLKRPSEDSLPVFVKLEEVDECEEYSSLDGTKKYRLTWFHETTGSTEGYTQFNTLEEAIEHFNIKPIERN